MLQIERLAYPLGKQLVSAGERLNEISAVQVNRAKAFRVLNGICYLEMAPGFVSILLNYEHMAKEMWVISLIGSAQFMTLQLISTRSKDEVSNIGEEQLRISTHVLPLTGRALKSIGSYLAA